MFDFALDRTRRKIGPTQRLGAFPSPGARALMAEIRVVVVAQSAYFHVAPFRGATASQAG